MTFREIAFDSAEYRQERALRDEVLRRPLGLCLDDDQQLERGHWHFGLFDGNERLIGCVVAVLLDDGMAKVRQMAIVATEQRRGHGRRILMELESRLAARGVGRLVLHARLCAVGFYERLGYVRHGDPFIEVTIEHVMMEKDLALSGQPSSKGRAGTSK